MIKERINFLFLNFLYMNWIFKSIFLLASYLILIPISGQNYNKLIDLEFDNQHVPKQVIEDSDGNLLFFLDHICENQYNCFSVNKVDVNDGSLNTIYLDQNQIHTGNNSPYLIEEDRIIVVGHRSNVGFDRLLIYEFDTQFNLINTHSFFENDNFSYFIDSIIKLGTSYYVLGEGKELDIEIPYVHLIKFDSTFSNINGKWRYTFGDKRTHGARLKIAPDKKLLFYAESDQFESNETDSLHIIKIDTLGNLIHNYSFEKNTGMNALNYLVLENGDYITQGNERGPIGEIYRIDHLNGEAKWQYLLPRDSILWNVPYQIQNYSLLNNGDILAFGRELNVFDENQGLGSAGFLIRLSQDGELIWLKRYLVENIFHPKEQGLYHWSTITNAHESSNGDIIFIGESVEKRTPIENSNFQYLWYSRIDKNGCYNDNCNELIVFKEKENEFSVGSKWTYQYEKIIAPSLEISSANVQIVDTVIWQGKYSFVIEPGHEKNRDYMTVDQSRVYFWDFDLNEYQLSYDFDEKIGYSFKYYSQRFEDIDSCYAKVDSISTFHFGSDSINVQHLHISCDKRSSYNINVYEGAGIDYDHPNFNKNEQLSDPSSFRTDLRCYTSDSTFIKFVSYSCDSTWLLTSTDNIQSDYKPVIIYPNPTKSILTLNSEFHIQEVNLFNTLGKLIYSELINSKKASIQLENVPSGTYYLRFYFKGNKRSDFYKIVKI